MDVFRTDQINKVHVVSMKTKEHLCSFDPIFVSMVMTIVCLWNQILLFEEGD